MQALRLDAPSRFMLISGRGAAAALLPAGVGTLAAVAAAGVVVNAAAGAVPYGRSASARFSAILVMIFLLIRTYYRRDPFGKNGRHVLARRLLQRHAPFSGLFQRVRYKD